MNEIQEFCSKKLKYLQEFIYSPDNNIGLQGVYVRNALFCIHFEKVNKATPDSRNFFWNAYIKEHGESVNLLVFRIKPEGKIFYIVSAEGVSVFKGLYPDAVRVESNY